MPEFSDAQIFVLHHTDARGRRRRLERQFRRMDLTGIEWVETYHPRDRDNWAIGHLVADGSIGETSCELKHRDALRRQAERRIPMAVIVEDDIELPDDFAAALPRWLAEFRELDGDVLMLGTCFNLHVPDLVPERAVYEAPAPTTRCTHAYVVRLEAAEVLSRALEHIEKGIGHDLNDIFAAEGLKICWLEPGLRQLTLEGEMVSAIEERHTKKERRAIRWRRLTAPFRR
jgi:GR25 family glycosyltransferase involved in LPS biosynthesis